MSEKSSNTTATVVVRALGFFRVLAFVALLAWPVFVIAATIGHSSNEDTWGVDISVFSSVAIDLEQLSTTAIDSTGVRDPKLAGKALMNIDTSSLTALYIFAALTEIGGFVGLYILLQLRTVFTALASGENFAKGNAQLIRKVGIVAIAWSLVGPILQFFGGRAILNEYALSLPGIELNPAFEINGLAIFIGVSMLVLAGVLREATQIHETQQLTI